MSTPAPNNGHSPQQDERVQLDNPDYTTRVMRKNHNDALRRAAEAQAAADAVAKAAQEYEAGQQTAERELAALYKQRDELDARIAKGEEQAAQLKQAAAVQRAEYGRCEAIRENEVGTASDFERLAHAYAATVVPASAGPTGR